jgi:hypothetical protein
MGESHALLHISLTSWVVGLVGDFSAARRLGRTLHWQCHISCAVLAVLSQGSTGLYLRGSSFTTCDDLLH